MRCPLLRVLWPGSETTCAWATNRAAPTTGCCPYSTSAWCWRARREASMDWPSSTSIAAISAALSSRSEEHTSELQSRQYLVCRLLLEKKKKTRVTGIWVILLVEKRLILLKAHVFSDLILIHMLGWSCTTALVVTMCFVISAFILRLCI